MMGSEQLENLASGSSRRFILVSLRSGGLLWQSLECRERGEETMFGGLGQDASIACSRFNGFFYLYRSDRFRLSLCP